MVIPRVTTDPTIGWDGENETIDESDPAMEGLTLQARKAAALVGVSNELLEDAPASEEALMTVLSGAMAAEACATKRA
jgi:HK97 family phage major capsid protein